MGVKKIARKKSRSKHNVDMSKKGKQNRTYKGVLYDSEMEMDYFIEVVEPSLISGEIAHCEHQPRYELQPAFRHNGKAIRKIEYVADFAVAYEDGRKEIIEVKGLADATAKLKRKMFQHKYPDEVLLWVSYSKMDGGWVDYDELTKLRSARKKARETAKKEQAKKKKK